MDPSSGKLLAIADQEGFVTILQTDRILPYSVRLDPGGQRPRAAWEAHKNLVHDLCWAKADSRLYTASGDSTVAVWDTSCATRLATGVEHQLSVKCLTAFGPGGDLFASGSRDGSILVWDVRLPGRRARMADGSSASTLACVWKAEGILSLSVTPQGDRLLVHCASGPHLLYSARAPQSGALATFHYPPSAHPANNRHKWFIRTAFSPDGTAFVAGAADSTAYVWQ
ncbi:denticleless protein-like protein, partial [Haematococcus lacustris]